LPIVLGKSTLVTHQLLERRNLVVKAQFHYPTYSPLATGVVSAIFDASTAAGRGAEP
jgi:hypothetical protein